MTVSTKKINNTNDKYWVGKHVSDSTHGLF